MVSYSSLSPLSRMWMARLSSSARILTARRSALANASVAGELLSLERGISPTDRRAVGASSATKRMPVSEAGIDRRGRTVMPTPALTRASKGRML